MGLSLPLSILIVHWIGDFLLQSNWMALNKSKHLDVLFIHALIYSACFYFGWGRTFFLLTFLSHITTDFFTSRWTAKLWFIDLKEEVKVRGLLLPTFQFARVHPDKRHGFFVVIGLDQLIHFTTLGLTLKYLNL